MKSAVPVAGRTTAVCVTPESIIMPSRIHLLISGGLCSWRTVRPGCESQACGWSVGAYVKRATHTAYKLGIVIQNENGKTCSNAITLPNVADIKGHYIVSLKAICMGRRQAQRPQQSHEHRKKHQDCRHGSHSDILLDSRASIQRELITLDSKNRSVSLQVRPECNHCAICIGSLNFLKSPGM